ncbi:MAG: hypothetical protein KJ737_25285 [Proteobacteria bacterium]|nr:hypothetical protein [Pseudomonadota bacterium]
MRFSILLYLLNVVLKIASIVNRPFKKYISKASTKVLIKTADGDRARLFVFDKGTVSSIPGNQKDFDVALVWKDAKTGFSVMTNTKKDAVFNAAAEGKLTLEGMSVYALWFEQGLKLIV